MNRTLIVLSWAEVESMRNAFCLADGSCSVAILLFAILKTFENNQTLKIIKVTVFVRHGGFDPLITRSLLLICTI